MAMAAPRIALIHAVAVAIPPVQAAFRTLWPEARTTNLFDDSLPDDRVADGDALTPAMSARIMSLARYVSQAGAQGILFTCSAFGPAIEAAARALAPVPVLKPNEAMFEEALRAGDRIGMLATFGPACASMEAEFAEAASDAGRQAAGLETVLVHGALDALKAGDAASHDQLVADAAPRLRHCDAVMLAHFSTSRALTAVREKVPGLRFLTAPDAAVAALRGRCR